jgi:hypothetical protein
MAAGRSLKEIGMRSSVFAIACAVTALLAVACDPKLPTPEQDRITAARWLTHRYSQSRLSSWNMRVAAIGNRCSVLLIQTSIDMDETLVESLHYGAGAYDIYPGGVNGYCRARDFRGVAYRDRSQNVWTYGTVDKAEVDSLAKCN